MNSAKIGLIGLGVMGQNLALNIERNGFPVAVYDREAPVLDAFVTRESGKRILGAHSPEEFVRSLERPRKIILLVKAGAPVDWTINLVKPFLDQGDIIIDGGNSHFKETERRVAGMAEQPPNVASFMTVVDMPRTLTSWFRRMAERALIVLQDQERLILLPGDSVLAQKFILAGALDDVLRILGILALASILGSLAPRWPGCISISTIGVRAIPTPSLETVWALLCLLMKLGNRQRLLALHTDFESSGDHFFPLRLG